MSKIEITGFVEYARFVETHKGDYLSLRIMDLNSGRIFEITEIDAKAGVICVGKPIKITLETPED